MRMGGLEAASLKVKLKYIAGWNSKRKEIAEIYQAKLDKSKFKLQYQPKYSDSVYHLFIITVDNRDKLINYLNENNIFPGLHYPVPCHLQKAYNHLNYKKGDLDGLVTFYKPNGKVLEKIMYENGAPLKKRLR